MNLIQLLSAPWQELLIAFLITYCCAQTIALVYEWTYEGLSYSKSFVHSLVLCAILCNAIVLVVGQSVAMGLGLLGIAAFVRFRTNIREIWDMSFLFATLVIGLSSGSYQYAISLMTTLFFCVIAIMSRFFSLGNRQQFDGIIRFYLGRSAPIGIESIEGVFHKHCRRYSLIALREGKQGDILEYSYQISLRHQHKKGDFIDELNKMTPISGLNLLLNEEHISL
jgi:hypothetical protein